jgi:hypothetical protein
MSSPVKCHCQSCTIRSLIGPAVVITVGVLWLLHEMHGGRFYFGSTWPVILIVIGIMHLAASMSSSEGHLSPPPPIGAPPVPPSPPAPTMGNPQTPSSSQGQ